jgi:hypothetical protein
MTTSLQEPAAHKRHRAPPQRTTHWIAAAAVLLALLLLAVLLVGAERWVRFGLVGHLWYLVVLLIGAALAAGTFKLIDHAEYSGQVLGGQLRIGGPAVLMLVVAVLGFVFAPKAVQKFDVTVFVHGEAGRQDRALSGQGRLALDLGADRREEAIGAKGEVRFVGIPPDQMGRSVAVSLVGAEGYELAQPGATVTLDREAAYLAVRPRRLTLHAQVLDTTGRAVAGAQWRLGGRSGTAAGDGSFQIEQLPAGLPSGERQLIVQAPGHEVWRGEVQPGGGPVTVQLKAVR